MTDAPKTLALDSAEWKALLLDNLARAHQAVTASQAINPEGLISLGQHLDRIKGIAAAWHASLPKDQLAPQPEPAPAQASANGAEKPRKGGWPKGKKRNAPRQAQAVQ